MVIQNSKIVKCQNCKQNFVLEPEDFAFYQKIKVPAPTWCPECRMIRRMVWRNERTLYKVKCGLCNKDTFSMYSPQSGFTVYCIPCWRSDKWDAVDYSKEYDWNKPFFVQFSEFMQKVPRISLSNSKENIDSEYSNYLISNKNVYLSFSITESENLLYSYCGDKSKDCIDCAFFNNCELCYENVDVARNYSSYFVLRSSDCINSLFLFDCVNCQHCFMSSNLRNKRYVFRNQQLRKEEYEQRISGVDLGSYQTTGGFIEEYRELISHSLHKFANLVKTTDCTGDNVYGSKNCYTVFNVSDLENVKYFIRGFDTKDGHDAYAFGHGELFYEGVNGGFGGNKLLFFVHLDNMRESMYTNMCFSSSHLFGCIGLRHKQYCILNKQYAKEEYEKLVPKIIQHMNKMPYIDKKGRVYKYGEFFPPELSPFAYNETIAQEYFPLTKKQAIEQGYLWKDPEERNYQITIKAKDLPDHIKDVKDDIVGKIIGCQHEGKCNEQCTEAFRIIPQELQFYKRMNLPLPRLCPNCRHYQRLKQRNPLKLWHRKCQCAGTHSENGVYKNTIKHFHGDNPCPNEFETTYSPDRPEIVYCESCYLNEVV